MNFKFKNKKRNWKNFLIKMKIPYQRRNEEEFYKKIFLIRGNKM